MPLTSRSTLFPYTTLFRSPVDPHRAEIREGRFWCSVAKNCPKLAVDRKSTRLNSSHLVISYAVFCLKKKSTAVTTLIDLVISLADCHEILNGSMCLQT